MGDNGKISSKLNFATETSLNHNLNNEESPLAIESSSSQEEQAQFWLDNKKFDFFLSTFSQSNLSVIWQYKTALKDGSVSENETCFRSIMDGALIFLGTDEIMAKINAVAEKLNTLNDAALCSEYEQISSMEGSGDSSVDVGYFWDLEEHAIKCEVSDIASLTEKEFLAPGTIGAIKNTINKEMTLLNDDLQVGVEDAVSFAKSIKGASLSSREIYVIAEALEGVGSMGLAKTYFNEAETLKKTQKKPDINLINTQLKVIKKEYKVAAGELESVSSDYNFGMKTIHELKQTIKIAKDEGNKLIKLQEALFGEYDEAITNNLKAVQQLLQSGNEEVGNISEELSFVSNENVAEFAKASLVFEAMGYFEDADLYDMFGEDLDVDPNVLASQLTPIIENLEEDIKGLDDNLKEIENDFQFIKAKYETSAIKLGQLSSQFITLDMMKSGIMENTEKYIKASDTKKKEIEAKIKSLVDKSQANLIKIRGKAFSQGSIPQLLYQSLSNADYDRYANILESTLFNELAAEQYDKAAEVSNTKAEKYYYIAKAFANKPTIKNYRAHVANITSQIDDLLAEAVEWENAEHEVRDTIFSKTITLDGMSGELNLPAGTPDQVHILNAQLMHANYIDYLRYEKTSESDFVSLEKKVLEAMKKRVGKATPMEAHIYGKLTSSITNRYVSYKGKLFDVFISGNSILEAELQEEIEKLQTEPFDFVRVDEDESSLLSYDWFFDVDKEFYLENLSSKTTEQLAEWALAKQFALVNTYGELIKPFTNPDKTDVFSELKINLEADLNFRGYANGMGLPFTALQKLNYLQENNVNSVALKDYIRTVKKKFDQLIVGGKANLQINSYDIFAARVTSDLMRVNDKVEEEASFSTSVAGYSSGIIGCVLSGPYCLWGGTFLGGLVTPVVNNIATDIYAEESPQYKQSLLTGLSPIDQDNTSMFIKQHLVNLGFKTLEGGFSYGMTAAFGLSAGRAILLGATFTAGEATAAGGLVKMVINTGKTIYNTGSKITSLFAPKASTTLLAEMLGSAGGNTLMKGVNKDLMAMASTEAKAELSALFSSNIAKGALWKKAKRNPLFKWLFGKYDNGTPPPLGPHKSIWQRIKHCLGRYAIDGPTGSVIYYNKSTGVSAIENEAGQFINLKTGNVIQETSGFALKKLGCLASNANSYDVIMSFLEKIAAPIWIMDLAYNYNEDPDKPMTNFGSLLFLIWLTRIGHERFGLNKSGQRIIFWADRIGDLITQFYSGRPLFKANVWHAALNYGMGTIVGQARGWWLQRFLASGKKQHLLKGAVIKVIKASGTKTSYVWKQELSSAKFVITKEPTKFQKWLQKGGGKTKNWFKKTSGADKLVVANEAEKKLINKLFNSSNGTMVIGIKPDGALVRKSALKKLFVGGEYGSLDIKLTPQEQKLLAKSVGEKSFSELFGTGQDMIKVVVKPTLTGWGLVAFCILHDSVLGTVYDYSRFNTVMTGSGMGAAKWTFTKGITTLPLQNSLKLFFGWDTFAAGISTRFLFRNGIDIYLTKFFQLWEGKGLFAYRLNEVIDDFKSPKDLMDDFIGPYPWQAGGFSRMKPAKILPSFLTEKSGILDGIVDNEKYEPIGSQHAKFAEFILTGKLGGKDIGEKYLLKETDLSILDEVITELMTHVIEVENGVAEPDEIDSKYDFTEQKEEALALAAVIFYVRKQGGDKYFPEFANTHAEILNIIGGFWPKIENELPDKKDKFFDLEVGKIYDSEKPFDQQVLKLFVNKIADDEISITPSAVDNPK